MFSPRGAQRLLSSLTLLSSAALFALGCAQEGSSEPVASAAATSPSSLTPMIAEEVTIDLTGQDPDELFLGRCVRADLPTDSRGIPSCVLLSARTLSAAPAGVAEACARCERPGTRVPSAATLARAKLPTMETGCLCELVAQPAPLGTNMPSADEDGYWYATEGPSPDETSLMVRACAVDARASLAMPARALEAAPVVLTLTCYGE